MGAFIFQKEVSDSGPWADLKKREGAKPGDAEERIQTASAPQWHTQPPPGVRGVQVLALGRSRDQ